MLLNRGVGEDSWESLGLQGVKPVNSKGTQSWISIGRTNAEAETPVLCPPDSKNWLIGKDSDVRKIEGRRRRGQQRMRWLDGITHSTNMSWVNSGSWWWIGSLVCCSPWGRKESDMTEQLNWIFHCLGIHCLFIYPSVNGYLGYFHFGAIINMSNAAVNIMYTFLCGQIFSILLGIVYLGVKLLGHRAPLYLTFQGAAKLFSKVAAPFYNPTRIVTGF